MITQFYLFVTTAVSLSWKCDYPEFGSLGKSHYLYKEDNVNEVKWLEKYDYCRAKGLRSVYSDAGKGKCEYSRGLCYWNNGCLNTHRSNDPLSECQGLLRDNRLVAGLDNGRLKQPKQEPKQEPTQPTQPQPKQPQPKQEPTQPQPKQEPTPTQPKQEPKQEPTPTQPTQPKQEPTQTSTTLQPQEPTTTLPQDTQPTQTSTTARPQNTQDTQTTNTGLNVKVCYLMLWSLVFMMQ
jgi:hypothetical protein